MAQPVLALGAALLTVSGSVWYVPALADLRAGADRPLSRRSAAAACVSAWATIGIIAALFLVTEAWSIPAVTAAGVRPPLSGSGRVRSYDAGARPRRPPTTGHSCGGAGRWPVATAPEAASPPSPSSSAPDWPSPWPRRPFC